ncbi:12756_t:CDS:1, partial [Gigaspora rosea]
GCGVGGRLYLAPRFPNYFTQGFYEMVVEVYCRVFAVWYFVALIRQLWDSCKLGDNTNWQSIVSGYMGG